MRPDDDDGLETGPEPGVPIWLVLLAYCAIMAAFVLLLAAC